MVANPDRINFGMGRKISDGNYGSIDIHFSYSTDVAGDEDLDSAIERCIEKVEEIVVKKQDEIEEALED